MNLLQTILIDVGRVGIGAIFLISVPLDFKSRAQVFELMRQKNLPLPWLFFIGAAIWKTVTSIGLIFNFYAFWAAILLAVYIFIANYLFNNFWAVPKESRDISLGLFMIHIVACCGLLVIAGLAW